MRTTPQAQTALASALERPVPQRSRGATVPDSTAHQRTGALVIPETKGESGQGTRKATPLGKRRRNDAESSRSNMAFRAQITREERLRRRPRPSLLLPGANRDAAARSAYSAALAESILLTLNEMETQETANPAPSTSVSWANCTVSVLDAQSRPSLDTSKGIDDVPPPTNTIPRVIVAQASAKPSTPQTVSTTPVQEPDPKQSVPTPKASEPQEPLPMTPVPTKAPEPEQRQHQRICGFEFTLPRREKGTKVAAYDDDPHVQFVLSAPPNLREPPVKVTKLNVAQVHTAAAPFDFISASSEAKPSEWRSTPSKPEKPNVGDEVEKADPDLKEAPSATCTDVTVNPLARFRQLKPGQWKCPGCSVLNEATHNKCPCCETAKPGGGAVGKVSPAVPNGPGSISSSGFSFGVATTETKEDIKKPATDSITTSGVTPAIEQKAAVSTLGFISPGFTFGSTTSTAEGSNTGKRKAQEAESLSKSSFSFGASASVTTQVFPTSSTPSFSFNATPVLIQESPKGSKRPMKSLAGSFGASDSTFEQTSSNPPQVSSNESTNTSFSTSSFNFGAPRSSITTEKTEDPTPAISFGVQNKKPSHTMEAKPMETMRGKTDFTFGSSSTAPSKPFAGFGQKTESKPCGFTFGQPTASASPSTELCFNSSSGFGSGSTAGSFGKSSPAPSAPALTFGASSQPLAGNASVPTPGRPAFPFGVASTAAPTVFGAAPSASSGFGSSGGFGATSRDFRSSPAPAFGNQAFGNQAPGYPLPPPTTTFGAPAFGAAMTNAFGNGPPSSGFHTPGPTPAFGAAPSTAFGANNPAPAFGVPTSAPGAFNVPTDGGFSMGVPPQHAKGRRILKARSRTRRTS